MADGGRVVDTGFGLEPCPLTESRWWVSPRRARSAKSRHNGCRNDCRHPTEGRGPSVPTPTSPRRAPLLRTASTMRRSPTRSLQAIAWA